MRDRPDPRLPALNQRVLVRPPGEDAPVPSRVEDHVGGDVVLAAPLDASGTPLPCELGAAVRVRWAGRTGPSELVGVLVGTAGESVAVWRLRPVSITTQPQRREFVRGAFEGPITVRAAGASIAGYLVNLSEGGLRATVGDGSALAVGDHVVAAFDVDGIGLLAPAEVVGVLAADEGGDDLRLVFSEMPERLRDQIRRAVFRRHREELRG